MAWGLSVASFGTPLSVGLVDPSPSESASPAAAMSSPTASPSGSAMGSGMATSGSDMPSPMGSGMPSPMESGMGSDMDSGMGGMGSMGPDILPVFVTWVWLIALGAVLVLHCLHMVRMSGQARWWHASHVLMIVSMIYMYAGMEYKWTWFPDTWWVGIFAATSVAIVAWMLARIVGRKPFSGVWGLALIMQASMVYMWLPDWWAPLTWLLVAYFTVETIAWLAGQINDCDGRMAVGPGDRSASETLAHPSVALNVTMAIMAASMAYMFAAMQLMR